jgi:uncharacterized protein YbjT (DUF2867 family)
MIVVTGATGHTGRPAAERLLAKGEKVRVIGRYLEKLETFVEQGAEAFVGNSEDRESMSEAFEGASAVYLVIPQRLDRSDFRAYQERTSDAYAAAVRNAGVRYVVTLSSIGAQHPEKTGPIVGLHNLEKKLDAISLLNVLHLRPGHFMENLFMAAGPIRTLGVFPGSRRSDLPLPWIATKDIGEYAAKRLADRDFSSSSTQELLGPRDMSMKEAARIVGRAIGKPGLGYMQLPFATFESALVQLGLPKSSAALLIEIGMAENAGLLTPQELRSARNSTPTTVEWFATEVFAPAYLGNAATA